MLLSGAVRSSTKELYRNHICIQDELRWRRGREHCPPALYQGAPLTLSLSPSSSSSLPPPLIYCLPLSIPLSPLSTPTTPTSSCTQHGSPCIVFPESSKVDRSLLIRAGFCTLSSGMDKQIFVVDCVHDSVCLCVCVCVRACPEACICEHIWVEIYECARRVCVWQYF